MKVILLKDIKNFGKKYEVKEVKDGFASNFLIPKKLAKKATDENMKQLENQKEAEVKKAEEELGGIQKIAEALEGQEVVIPVKVGENDQLFESVTSQKISEKLKEMGFDIKREQINLEETLKELGEFQVKINFKHNLESEIKIVISSEEA